MADQRTIGDYLVEQLKNHGVRHVFGVPGDYSLALIQTLAQHNIQFVNTCDEQGAGYAADAYARVQGLGAVCITYAVGSLKVANTTAQAFAERSAVVVICGAPGMAERVRHPLLHHRVNDYDTQLRIFEQLTAHSAVVDDEEQAARDIDRALHTAEREKRPVYLEVPRDRVNSPIRPGHRHVDVPPVSDPDVLSEAVAEAAAIISEARRPIILAGEEIMRFGLDQELIELADRLDVPIAASFLGKSVVREDQPRFVGVYAGAIGPQSARDYIESSDCVLVLGAMLTDLNLGIFTARLERPRMICAVIGGVDIRHHHYDVQLADFLAALKSADVKRPDEDRPAFQSPRPPAPFEPRVGQNITVDRLFAAVDAFLTERMIVIADVGDSLFGAVDLQIRRTGGFLSAAYYSDMGFAVPGAVGAQIGNRRLRPVVLVGDGAFQMTGMELSTAARYKLSPVVIVLNNGGYATERFFLDGTFNDIQPWRFSRLGEIIGGGIGFDVRTEDELAAGLRQAEQHTDGFVILDVHLAPGDVSSNLARLGQHLARRVRG